MILLNVIKENNIFYISMNGICFMKELKFLVALVKYINKIYNSFSNNNQVKFKKKMIINDLEINNRKFQVNNNFGKITNNIKIMRILS